MGDVLVTRGSGSADLVGDAATVLDTGHTMGLFLSDLTYRIRKPRVEPEYLTLALVSPQGRAALRRQVRQGTGPAKARGEDILALEIPASPRNGQLVTLARVADQRTVHRAAVHAIRRSIELLYEYKQSLITAAVSGELNVTSVSRRGVPK